MRYQIVYVKPNSEQPLSTWKESEAEARVLADQLRGSGYSVDVWEHTEAGGRKTGI